MNILFDKEVFPFKKIIKIIQLYVKYLKFDISNHHINTWSVVKSYRLQNRSYHIISSQKDLFIITRHYNLNIDVIWDTEEIRIFANLVFKPVCDLWTSIKMSVKF